MINQILKSLSFQPTPKILQEQSKLGKVVQKKLRKWLLMIVSLLVLSAVEVGRTEYPNFCYYQVNENWQVQTCERLGLTYTQKFACQCGSPDTILTCPDLRSLKHIAGDGNCLFRAISYIITGSERQHSRLRDILIGYMLSIPHLLIGQGPDGRTNYVDTLASLEHCTVYPIYIDGP